MRARTKERVKNWCCLVIFIVSFLIVGLIEGHELKMEDEFLNDPTIPEYEKIEYKYSKYGNDALDESLVFTDNGWYSSKRFDK